MRHHTTLRTRPRCERLADRTGSGPLATVLLTALLLALVHPAAPAVGFALVGAHRLDRASPDRAPTGHGVRFPAASTDRP
ncbi:MAG: hypothetical protein ABEI80_06800 [Haloplanus sp.]